jgi:hypothetical protein
MAAIAITAANVLASASAIVERGYNFGAAVTQGQVVYLNTSNQWVLADADTTSGTALTAKVGIALNGGSSGQPASVCLSDTDFTLGGTMTNGKTQYLFTTPGAISEADIPTTAGYPVILGVAKSTTKMNFRPLASGVVI